MDLLTLLQVARACLREFWHFKYVALLMGAVLAFLVLAFGVVWKEKYTVTTTLYADNQNIIQPLLAGQATVTKFEDRVQIVKDTMLSNKLLKEVVESVFVEGEQSDAQRDAQIARLRGKILVQKLGKNYIGVTYSDIDPERAYKVVTVLVENFIYESNANKQSESKQAYLFIDRQVNTYKEQLRKAEENLKNFKTVNVDLVEGRIAGNIEGLRVEITNLDLNLQQVIAKINTLSAQIEQEDRYLTSRAQSNDYRQRLAEAVKQLDQLKLSLTDNHPDVINMKQYIEALRAQTSASSSTARGDDFSEGIQNPVYDQLRSQLAAEKVERSSIEKRLDALKDRLQYEKERGKLVAEKGATLAELTRDYNVTKGLYEDLLQRKEKARLSMTLDLEGQGVTYKIHEPGKFPLSPSGLQFSHFATLGMVMGIVAPLGVIIAYVLLDPRVRYCVGLEKEIGVELLEVLPTMETTADKMAKYRDMRVFLVLLVITLLAYVASAGSYILLG